VEWKSTKRVKCPWFNTPNQVAWEGNLFRLHVFWRKGGWSYTTIAQYADGPYSEVAAPREWFVADAAAAREEAELRLIRLKEQIKGYPLMAIKAYDYEKEKDLPSLEPEIVIRRI
jgi:hypothetical protein